MIRQPKAATTHLCFKPSKFTANFCSREKCDFPRLWLRFFPTESGPARAYVALQKCRLRRRRPPLLRLRPPRPKRHAHAHRTSLQPGTVCLHALTIPCRALTLAEAEEGRHGLGELQAWPRHEVGQGTAGLQEHTEIAAQRQMCAALPSDAAQCTHAHSARSDSCQAGSDAVGTDPPLQAAVIMMLQPSQRRAAGTSGRRRGSAAGQA